MNGPYRTTGANVIMTTSRPSLASRLRAWWWRRTHYVRAVPWLDTDASPATPTIKLTIRCGSFYTTFVLSNGPATHAEWYARLVEGRDNPISLSHGVELIPAEIIPELKRVVAAYVPASS